MWLSDQHKIYKVYAILTRPIGAVAIMYAGSRFTRDEVVEHLKNNHKNPFALYENGVLVYSTPGVSVAEIERKLNKEKSKTKQYEY